MGNSCGGEREPVDAAERRLVQTRKASPDWAAAFKHMQEQSYDFNPKEQTLQLGSSVDELGRWAHQRMAKLSLLPHQTLEKLWRKYDLNGDGSLSLDEMTVMLTDYLSLAREEIPLAMLHSLKQHFSSLGMTTSEIEVYLENPDVEESIQSMKKGLELRFEHWIGNAEAFASTIFHKLDTDGDGNVSKETFMSKFPRECEKVLNISDVRHIVRGLSARKISV